jgi:hypothetical protein
MKIKINLFLWGLGLLQKLKCFRILSDSSSYLYKTNVFWKRCIKSFYKLNSLVFIVDSELLKFSLCSVIAFPFLLIFLLKLCGEVSVHMPCISSCCQFSVFCIFFHSILNITPILFSILKRVIYLGLCFVCSSCCHHTKWLGWQQQ